MTGFMLRLLWYEATAWRQKRSRCVDLVMFIPAAGGQCLIWFDGIWRRRQHCVWTTASHLSTLFLSQRFSVSKTSKPPCVISENKTTSVSADNLLKSRQITKCYVPARLSRLLYLNKVTKNTIKVSSLLRESWMGSLCHQTIQKQSSALSSLL